MNIAHQANVWLEISTLLILGQNDSDDEVQSLSTWIANNLGIDIPLHFSAFHPDWKMKNIAATPAPTLQRARRLAMAEGLQFVYTGNIDDTEGASTWCPECKALLIERNYYRLNHWGLDKNACCLQCGYRLVGHFESNGID